MGLVALRGRVDAGAAQQSETPAIEGARLGGDVVVAGAGGAQAGEAFAGVRGPVLRPPCMLPRSLPWIAGERQRSQRGCGRRGGGEAEVRVAAGFFRGRGVGGGGGEGRHCQRS